MPEALKRFLTICFVVCAAMSYVHAQPKALGTSYSFNGPGITYEHYLNPECFINADIRAEMLAYFMDRTDSPGVSASLSCSFIINEWSSRNNNTIRLFAGPGVAIGMAHNFRKDMGYFFGLKGCIGAECRFDRHISLSLSLNPVLGSHMVLREEHLEMKYYRNGLINTILPEIGIKYTFGS